MLILKLQDFSDERLLEFAASLSSKEGGCHEKLLHWEFGPIMNMSYDKNAKNYLFSDEKVPFHWDGAFYKEPKKLLFYCTESQGEGGETLLVDTERIWDDLTSDQRELWSGVTMIYRTQKLAHYGGEIKIPLVQRHPETGKTILRMAERVTTKLNPVELDILGTDNPQALYQELVEKLYNEKYLYRHQWNKGDLLVIDNFTYLHGRNPLGNNKSRSFKRIQIL